MQFLRTLFWVVVAVIAVVFSVRNWIPVTVNLWGGIVADVKLPVLLAVAFLIGFLPIFALHRATRWRLRRRLENAERALGDVRPADAPEPAGTLPPGAVPIAVPPAV